MSYDWLIATPAWGERCVGLFVERTLPGIVAAAARCGGTFRFMVHTDEPDRVKAALDSRAFPHRVLPIPKGDDTPHVKFGHCHRAALQEARRGECIAFINADMVASVEVFEAAEKRFEAGKRMIMMAATRTQEDRVPPIGAASAELLRWAMANRHKAIDECFWGTGKTTVPWAIYFQRGDDIVLHGFHLHPFAVLKDRDIKFERKTIDADLPNNFTTDEVHLVTDADEASFAEQSPDWRVFKLFEHPFNVANVAAWVKRTQSPMHARWFFQQRIAICGSGEDIGDGEVCDEILRATRF